MIGDLERQGLDPELTLHLREHAAFLDADRLADQVDRNLRLDRLVEPHLVQVDVREPAAGHVLLVVLEHGRVGRLLTGQDDVEDRVQTRVARQGAPKIALGDEERVRLLAATVEHPRHETLCAQAPRVGGAAPVALGDLQLHAFAGHVGGEV